MLRHSRKILIWHYNTNINNIVINLYPSNDDIDTSTDDTTLEFTPEGIILNCEVPAYSKYEKLYYRIGWSEIYGIVGRAWQRLSPILYPYWSMFAICVFLLPLVFLVVFYTSMTYNVHRIRISAKSITGIRDPLQLNL